MSLERHTVSVNGNEFTRLIGEKVSSEQEIVELAEVILGGNYFYGGVIDTGTEIRPYFGQGPNHEIFKQMIQDVDGQPGSIYTCQIGIDRRRHIIDSVLFLEDPGKKADHLSVRDEDDGVSQRRESRISALATELPKESCRPVIPVGWFEGYDHMVEYEYRPQSNELTKHLT